MQTYVCFEMIGKQWCASSCMVLLHSSQWKLDETHIHAYVFLYKCTHNPVLRREMFCWLIFFETHIAERDLQRNPKRRHSPTLNKNVMSCSVASMQYSPSFAMPSSRGGRSEAQQNPPRCACHSCYGVSSASCKATLLHIHCTTSCTLPVKLWLKPHLKSQLT